jgi:acetyl esterase/lipase
MAADMFDEELRWPAVIARTLMHPWPWYFRMMAAISKTTRGMSLKGLSGEEIGIPRSGENSRIRTRIYKRFGSQGPVPALLYLHGGGYFMGSPEVFGPSIRGFIETRDCIVIAPDYRKSFEAPYPAAIDDCYDTLVWIKKNAQALGVRADQIMVAGHSAGGGLTAALTLRARDRGEVNIAFQMPIYPMIDDRMLTESARDNHAPLWNSKLNALGWALYLRDLQQRQQPIPYDAAPARAHDYSNLPPTMTFVGELEPFRDETIAYVENLRAAGVPVEFAIFKGCFHGFDLFATRATVSKRATEFAMKSFARAVANYFAPQDS